MENNKCQRCAATADLMVISRRTLKSGERRCSYMCRSCNTARIKKYRSTPEGMARQTTANKTYEASHPTRVRAWRMAAYHLPIQPCEAVTETGVCGSTTKVHRHHDEPSKPLDVIFLCPAHHKSRHRWLDSGQVQLQIVSLA